MGIMKNKPTSIYGQLLYYAQRFRLARHICIESGLRPNNFNIMIIMGRDYHEFVEAQQSFREIINKSLIKEQKIRPPRRSKRRAKQWGQSVSISSHKTKKSTGILKSAEPR